MVWGIQVLERDITTGSLRERREKYLANAEEAQRHADKTIGELREGYLKLAAGWRQMVAELDHPRIF